MIKIGIGTKKQSSIQKMLLCFVISVLIAAFCEIAFFNYQSIETMQAPNQNASIENNEAGNRSILLNFQENEKGGYSATIKTNGAISTLAISTDTNEEQEFQISIQDEGSGIAYPLGNVAITNAKTFRINPQGSVYSISIETIGNSKPNSATLTINNPIPFDISKSRLFAIALLCVLAYLISRSPPLSSRPYNDKKLFFIILFACFAIPTIGICAASAVPANTVGYEHHHQYYELVQALTSGKVSLLASPSPELLELNNPYDTAVRAASGTTYLWDHAFFNGKYYVYFGVLPAIVYYLPFYLITSGGELPNWIAVCISSLIFLGGAICLLYQLCKKWFPHITQSSFLLSFVVLILGSWIVYDLIFPDLYVVPTSLGLACVAWGLSLILKSVETSAIKRFPACFGSLLLACTALCRPQFLIFGTIAIFIAINHILNNRDSANANIISLGIACIPILLVACIAGAYNNARFGSPFDFGANYNLTTNDMTHRGSNLDRLPLAFFSYLIEPPAFSLSTHSFIPVNLDTDYLGITISQSMYGGTFSLTPVIFFAIVIYIVKPHGKKSSAVSCLIAISLICTMIIVAFDANGAGILMRYFNDFGLLLALAALLSTLSLENRLNACAVPSAEAIALHRCLEIAAIVSVAIQLLIIASW